MKKFLNTLTILSVLSLVIFISCKGDGTDPVPEPTAEQIQAEKIVGKTWKATVTGATIKLDAQAAAGWENFTLTFTGNETGGNFTTTNAVSPLVWPSQGTWKFQNGVTTLLRSDNVQMTLNVTVTQMTLAFTIVDPGSGKAQGFGGNWTFDLLP
jgi:hypothetical protein